jgi:DNA-binding response OmpR family regulator
LVSGEKILFVDDEVLIRRLVSTYLDRRGYSVTTATDGAEALRLIAADRPDLLITDVRMPHMNGLELANRLRSNQQTDQMPIIMLSAYNEIDDTLAGYGQGADDYVPKPVELAVLGAKVEVLLRQVNGPQTTGSIIAGGPPLDNRTVLVVEDDPTVRLLECSLLRHAGYSVVEASNGEQALTLASESRPDLVVLDVSLPSISGLQVLHALADHEFTRTVPVLVVSSYVPLIGEEHRFGMAGTLSKPFDPTEFLSVVGALVHADPYAARPTTAANSNEL